jgi:hypothetical protein
MSEEINREDAKGTKFAGLKNGKKCEVMGLAPRLRRRGCWSMGFPPRAENRNYGLLYSGGVCNHNLSKGEGFGAKSEIGD